MKDFKEFRASMKRKREQTASKRRSEMFDVIFVTQFIKEKFKFKSGNMFRFLSQEFRIRLKSDERIIVLSSLFSLSSKFLFRSTFFRISVGIFHDGVFFAKLRGSIMRERIEKLAFFGFKINNDIQQFVFFFMITARFAVRTRSFFIKIMQFSHSEKPCIQK